MDNRTICRVCLVNGVRLHAIIRTELQEIYEKLANNKLEANDEKPEMLCYICYAQLRRCHWFSKVAKTSEEFLSQIYHGGVNGEFSQEILPFIERAQVYQYSVSPIESVNIYANTSDGKEVTQLSPAIKSEIVCENTNENTNEDKVKDLPPDVKLDPDCESNSNADFNVSRDSESDSEDNVPLNNLKKAKGVRKKRKYTKRLTIDARLTTLSIEQQRAAVAMRAASLNYLQSPYRCSLCYRGFVSQDAFVNHQAKHDERRGAHECAICRLRYRSARLLRTHTSAAHAHTYTCNKCGHRTHTKHQASDHERWHNGHTYQCQLCSMNFAARTSYLTHIRSLHAPEVVCRACGGRYLGAHGLRMHQAKAHAGHDISDSSAACDRYCATCDIQFWSRRAWAKHVATDATHAQHAARTKQCPICLTDIQGSTTDHMREHERALRRPRAPPPAAGPGGDVVRVACDQCSQTFVNKSKLTAHVRRIHLGFKYNKNIVCEVCGKKCTSNATLKYHQRTHTGERPHPCARCGKRFTDTNQLRIHARTHTGERPYACAHCGKRFAQKPALNRHYRVHTGAKPYTCELCSKSFSQSNSLKVHVKAVHLKMPAYKRKTRNDIGKSSTNVDLDSTNVCVGGTNVGVGGTNVCASGTNVGVGGTNVCASGTNVGVGGTNVCAGGTNVAVGGTNVCAGGTNVGVGGTNVCVGGTNVCAGGTNVGMTGTDVDKNGTGIQGSEAIKIDRKMIK